MRLRCRRSARLDSAAPDAILADAIACAIRDSQLPSVPVCSGITVTSWATSGAEFASSSVHPPAGGCGQPPGTGVITSRHAVSCSAADLGRSWLCCLTGATGITMRKTQTLHRHWCLAARVLAASGPPPHRSPRRAAVLGNQVPYQILWRYQLSVTSRRKSRTSAGRRGAIAATCGPRADRRRAFNW